MKLGLALHNAAAVNSAGGSRDEIVRLAKEPPAIASRVERAIKRAPEKRKRKK